ncbi:hypothetical protein BJX63DRAFT_140890 [Aspergillus granulosus]|uniref:Uncharacterized protein n=1 Tax=Aspergillus granulosus TaxID=176169 RepID=A0ABR4GTT5_9EURO
MGRNHYTAIFDDNLQVLKRHLKSCQKKKTTYEASRCRWTQAAKHMDSMNPWREICGGLGRKINIPSQTWNPRQGHEGDTKLSYLDNRSGIIAKSVPHHQRHTVAPVNYNCAVSGARILRTQLAWKAITSCSRFELGSTSSTYGQYMFQTCFGSTVRVARLPHMPAGSSASRLCLCLPSFKPQPDSAI